MKKALTLLTLLVSSSVIASENRSILEGAPNFRDLGGYETSDGLSLKKGVIYRSGELPRLTEKDITKLDELGIHKVVNFLEASEIVSRGEGKLPSGVGEIHLPITGEIAGDMVDNILQARIDGDFSKIPVSVNSEVHRLLAHEGVDSYSTFLQEVIASNGEPMIYHCSHGVHRTGTATAILLHTVGVPWEAVRDDYLLSNEYRSEENAKRINQLNELASKNENVTDLEANLANIEAFYLLQSQYIDATYDEIIDSFGSFDSYVSEVLGVTSDDIEQLKSMLLE